MYNINFLPIAKKDIENIIFYISHVLNNENSAGKLIDNIKNEIKNIYRFPYGNSIYHTNNKMLYCYRCAIVNNYLLFYVIDEKNRTITVVRFIHSKMNIENYLK